MKIKKVIVLNIAFSLIISSAIVFFSQKEFFKRQELISTDFFFHLKGPGPFNPNICIIHIDDYNISKIGQWPWPRTWQAAIITALKYFGAKYIYEDVVFSEESNPEEDELMAQAIKEAKNVYLPYVFTDNQFDKEKSLKPIPKLAEAIIGTGALNIGPDRDGVLRTIPLVFSPDKKYDCLDNKKHSYHVAFQIACDYLGARVIDLNSRYLVLEHPKGKTYIPLVDNNKMIVHWYGRWQKTFKHYSFLDIVDAYAVSLEGGQPKIDVKPLKNSICLVGLTAIGLYDIKPVPLEPAYPGIGIIATVINNIIEEDFISVIPNWIIWILVYLLGLIPALLISGDKPLKEISITIVIGLVFFIVAFLFFIKGIILNFTLPLISLFLSYLSIETYDFIRIALEKQKLFKLAVTDELTSLYNIRYFKMLLHAECQVARKIEANRKFCIVMTDIDHFKKFNDTYGHQVGDLVLKEVAKAIRSTLRLSDVVARYGGEEMIVLLRGVSLENGMEISEKIRKSVENYIVKDEKNVYKVTISLGVSFYNLKDNPETIVKRADAALYKSKEEGRNRVSTLEDNFKV